MDFIPQIQPWIDNAELEELAKVIKSTYISENEATKEFESLLQQITGAKYVIAYANGTLGLAASLMVLGIGQGDEVIVPDLTFIATANAVILAGATPVICDINESGWQMSPASLRSKITSKTKAVIPVHLYGQSAKMDEIISIAKDHKIFVIEDAAESIGTTYNGKHVGTIGDIGMISFYANKIITSAEGAVMLTNDEKLAKELYKMKNHGREKKGIFIHESIGFNFSFSDINAAVGIAQLKKLSKILTRKKEINDKYLAELKSIVKFYEHPPETSPVYWFTNIEIPDAGKLEKFLRENGIGSRRYFYPLHLQPCYKGKFGTDFPNATKAYETGLSLPSSYSLTDEQQSYVISKIKEFFKS